VRGHLPRGVQLFAALHVWGVLTGARTVAHTFTIGSGGWPLYSACPFRNNIHPPVRCPPC
jgi:hypothetical protein